MGLIMLIDGFPKEQYILENENEQTIRLKLKKKGLGLVVKVMS
jgi:hypothetical protein